MPVFAVDNLPSFCVSPCPCCLCCECHVTATVTASRQSSGQASIKTFEFPFNLRLTKCGKFNVWIINNIFLSLIQLWTLSYDILQFVIHPVLSSLDCPTQRRLALGLLLLKLEGWRRREYVKIFLAKYNLSVSTVSILLSVQVSIPAFYTSNYNPNSGTCFSGGSGGVNYFWICHEMHRECQSPLKQPTVHSAAAAAAAALSESALLRSAQDAVLFMAGKPNGWYKHLDWL